MSQEIPRGTDPSLPEEGSGCGKVILLVVLSLVAAMALVHGAQWLFGF